METKQSLDVFWKGGAAIVYWMTLCAGALLAGAAAWDLWTHRIPNKWLGFWLAVGILGNLGDLPAVLAFLGSGALAAAVTFGLFVFRMIGAGDCKLMALVCGFLGIWDGGRVILAGLVIGGGWSLGKLVWEGQCWERWYYFQSWLSRSLKTRSRIPYYVSERDGFRAAIPLAVCLLGGFLGYTLLG